MSKQAGYWIDLKSLQFDDGGDRARWVQIFPYGEYKHPIHGQIKMDRERAVRFAQNFHSKVRGQDLDVDYDHKERDGKAAGWFKDMQARDDGLWAQVEWTQPAYDAVAAGEYRYFSPEFVDVWTHPKTGVKHQDVIFGGALTNRPFLKDILPINFTEVTKETPLMDPKALRAKLGLAEDATDEEVNEKLAQLTAPPEPPPTPDPTTDPPEPKGDGKEEPQLVSATELEAMLKKFSEGDNAEMKALGEAMTGLVAQNKQLADNVGKLETANRLAEVSAKMSDLESGNKKFAIPPAIKDKVKGVILASDPKVGDQVLELFKELSEAGLVELGERGGAGGDHDPVTDAKKFSDLVDETLKANDKLDYIGAVDKVAADHPDLYNGYRYETIKASEV